MSVKLLILSNFIFFNLAFAQSSKTQDSLRVEVGRIVRDAIQDKKIKDSTALYSLSITIDVSLKKGQQVVNLSTNNLQFSPIFDSTKLNKLSTVNYNSLMKKRKRMTFSFKVCLVVYNSKYDPHLILAEEVSKSLKNLFLKDEFEITNLGSLLIEFDKKIYN